jgi:hypothetical protein
MMGDTARVVRPAKGVEYDVDAVGWGLCGACQFFGQLTEVAGRVRRWHSSNQTPSCPMASNRNGRAQPGYTTTT